MQSPLPASLPVLVLWGEEDGAIEKRLSYGMDSHVPNLQVRKRDPIWRGVERAWKGHIYNIYTYIIYIIYT